MRSVLNPPTSAAGKAQRRRRGATEGEKSIVRGKEKGGTTWTRISPLVDV